MNLQTIAKSLKDGLSASYMKDVLVDYVKTAVESGLKFIFKDGWIRQCGCEKSFSP